MLLYDSTNPNAIPTTAEYVGGYVDGLYAWSAAGWARFPKARKRRIAAENAYSPSNTADFERYNLTPAEAPIWARHQMGLGEIDLWAYASRDAVNYSRYLVEDALWAAGIPLDAVSMWIATLDGTQVVPVYRYPVAAVQYIDTGGYDLSVVDSAYTGGSGSLGEDMTDLQAQQLADIHTAVTQGFTLQRIQTDLGTPDPLVAPFLVARIKAAIGNVAGGGGLTADQANELSACLAGIEALSKHLGVGTA